jgi:hypothetical protein
VDAANVSASAVSGCGSSAPDLVVPFGVTAKVNDSYLWCPSCLGLSGNSLAVTSTANTAMYCLGSLVVQAGGVVITDDSWEVTWAKPLTIVVDGDVTIAGTVNMNGRTPSGYAGGPGGNGGGKGGNRCNGDGCGGLEGTGTGRGRGGQGDSSWCCGEAGGGSGGSFGGKAGNGGDSDTKNGGLARAPYGNSTLTPLQGGSGGGAGGRHDNNNNHGAAGGGGGTIQFTVRGTLTLAISGILTSSGGQGGNGSSRGGAGGGGSGGGVLIESRIYQDSGGTVFVHGGNGGSAAAGSGGGGASANGMTGGKGSSTDSGGAGGAGGGGGAGRIRIQATSGQTCNAASPAGACSSGGL